VWRYCGDPAFSPFGTVPACDRRTDRWTHDDSMYRTSIALHGKNCKVYWLLFAAA